jgi:serine/threonine-protein kinase RsbW
MFLSQLLYTYMIISLLSISSKKLVFLNEMQLFFRHLSQEGWEADDCKLYEVEILSRSYFHDLIPDCLCYNSNTAFHDNTEIIHGRRFMEKRFEGELPDEIIKPALAHEIPALVTFVSTHAWEAGFEDERIRQIGRAVEEALQNIVRFACPNGAGEIRIACHVHDSGALITTIVDTGKPFNMLLVGTFPETADFFEPGKTPSTGVMKQVIKNIEYRRGSDRNTLVFTIPPSRKEKS